MNSIDLIAEINSDKLNDSFIKLYGNNEDVIKAQKKRYVQAVFPADLLRNCYRIYILQRSRRIRELLLD